MALFEVGLDPIKNLCVGRSLGQQVFEPVSCQGALGKNAALANTTGTGGRSLKPPGRQCPWKESEVESRGFLSPFATFLGGV